MVGDTGLVPILLGGLDGMTSRPWDDVNWFSGSTDLAGIGQLDPAGVLAEGWPYGAADCEEDEDLAAELATIGWQFPGLAPPEQTRLSEAELQRALGSLPPARIGLIPATRGAPRSATNVQTTPPPLPPARTTSASEQEIRQFLYHPY